jgi:hypothetical protein
MGELRCVDGSVLNVVAVACRDRMGRPYEVTLDLRRGPTPFATVGERCGFRLTQLAARVTAARQDPAQAAAWPDPDDRFPEPAPPSGREGFRPGEREYFSLRSRERDDPPGTGEFRCVLRDSAQWAGGWRLTRRAVIEAWGTDGIGLRAVLTSAELVTFLDTVLMEPVSAMVTGRTTAGANSTTAGSRLVTIGRSSWRQRGRVRDESARSRLPALRAQNRSVAFASGDPPARGGDVRR